MSPPPPDVFLRASEGRATPLREGETSCTGKAEEEEAIPLGLSPRDVPSAPVECFLEEEERPRGGEQQGSSLFIDSGATEKEGDDS